MKEEEVESSQVLNGKYFQIWGGVIDDIAALLYGNSVENSFFFNYILIDWVSQGGKIGYIHYLFIFNQNQLSVV